jgi:DNA repair protein RadC
MAIVIGIKKPDKVIPIYTPKKAAEFVKEIREEEDEVFFCIYLNPDLEITGFGPVAVGSLMSVSIEPKNIFRFPFTDKWTKFIIIAHNHPGQREPRPSSKDEDKTYELTAAGRVNGFPIVDALVIGLEGYYSFMEHGKIWIKGDSYREKMKEEEDKVGENKHKGSTRAKRDELRPYPIVFRRS